MYDMLRIPTIVGVALTFAIISAAQGQTLDQQIKCAEAAKAFDMHPDNAAPSNSSDKPLGDEPTVGPNTVDRVHYNTKLNRCIALTMQFTLRSKADLEGVVGWTMKYVVIDLLERIVYFYGTITRSLVNDKAVITVSGCMTTVPTAGCNQKPLRSEAEFWNMISPLFTQ
jgi:hypothetical protein